MFELRPENAADYVGYPCTATALGGGVSNTVLLIEGGPQRLVLKQALGKLRVEEDWFSQRERIYREASALRLVSTMLPRGSVPEVLLEDRANFIYGMSAAPAGSDSWKERLLRGEIRVETAAQIGNMLAAMMERSWGAPEMEREFGDQSIFDELRLDPYYRTAARRHPDLAGRIDALMRESADRRVCLVHGDWSPKNFLVWDTSAMAIDFEVVHFGDPAFDAAFLLNHLLLKSFLRPEWATRYRDAGLAFWAALPRHDWLEAATIGHWGALLLARVDGKSPAEYIQGERAKVVREFARGLILRPPATVPEVFHLVQFHE